MKFKIMVGTVLLASTVAAADVPSPEVQIAAGFQHLALSGRGGDNRLEDYLQSSFVNRLEYPGNRWGRPVL